MEPNKTKVVQDIPANPDGGINKSRQSHCSGTKHMLIMILCCLTPIGLIWVLNKTGYAGNLNYLILFLCPLMHLFMMRGMRHEERK